MGAYRISALVFRRYWRHDKLQILRTPHGGAETALVVGSRVGGAAAAGLSARALRSFWARGLTILSSGRL